MNTKHFILASFILFLVVNVLLLDLMVFSQNRKPSPSAVSTQRIEPLNCPAACESVINQRLSERTQTTTEAQPAAAGGPLRTAREFYVPLGSGKTKNDEYEALPGAEASIDTRQYPIMRKVVFETYLRLPQGVGRMFVKLYNATDNLEMWGSEVDTEATTSTRKEVTITLSPGSKLYRVMAKSTIRSDAYLDNARIKIVTY